MTRKPIVAFLGSLSLGFLLALAGMAAALGTVYLSFAPFQPTQDHGQVLLEAIAQRDAQPARSQQSLAGTGGGYEITAAALDATTPLAATEATSVPAQALEREPGKPANDRRRAPETGETAYGPARTFLTIDRSAP